MKSLLFTPVMLLFSLTLSAVTGDKQLQLRLVAPYGSYDQTTIYFDYGLTPTFTASADAPKVMVTLPGFPNIYSITSDNVKCQTYGYSPLTQSAVIPLGLLLDSSTFYTFTLNQYSNFDSTTLVILEDRQMNTFTDLQVNFYQAALTPNDTTGRFFLHVTRPVQFNTVTAGCSNNNGAISISADSSITWSTVALLDSSGATLTSSNNLQGQFGFNSLAEGNYNVLFNYNGYSTTRAVFVDGNYITAAFTASSQNVVVGETISFISTTINTTDYVWEFGDSTVETGVANPTYFYYEPGVYTVILTCSNAAGCSATAQTTITVSQSTGINGPASTKKVSIINLGSKTVEILMNDLPLNNAELQVYNILGQDIYSSPITANQTEVSLANQPSGIYLVSVLQGGKSFTTKIYIN